MKHAIYYLLFFYAIVCALTIAFFNGTGDSGDSVTHYLFARYAPSHPVLYFDHWAKPVFVLLASPFAQFGFIGIKIFNSIISLAVIFFTYKTAEQLQLKNAWLVALLLIFSPLFYILTFSGLTEPLFALFSILGLYSCVRSHYNFAAIIISFLPYVRSEGLIIIGVISLYFAYKGLWKTLPILFFGSIIYGFVGFFVHGSFLWVFNKIPYATLGSVYGHGNLLHFVEQLINVTGVPIYFIFWTGFLALIIVLIKTKRVNAEQHILLLIGFCAFFIAHSLFWYLGIFSSMGLKRVLIGMMPIIALISLIGFNAVTETIITNEKIKKGFQLLLLGYILVFPFTANPSAIHWEKDLNLSSDQSAAKQLAESKLLTENTNYPLLFNYNYMCLLLDIDYFNKKECQHISYENITKMNANDLLVWDNVSSRYEGGLQKKDLDLIPDLEILQIFKTTDSQNEIVFCVYKKRATSTIP
jgi:hypothetical protein